MKPAEGVGDHRKSRSSITENQGADDAGAGDEGAQPVRQVDQLQPRYAGEQVLVAAGEPYDLVGEHGPDDEDEVGTTIGR
jgi:hypothetical protein